MLNSKKHRFTQLVIIQRHYLPLSLSFLTCYQFKNSAGLILTEGILNGWVAISQVLSDTDLNIKVLFTFLFFSSQDLIRSSVKVLSFKLLRFPLKTLQPDLIYDSKKSKSVPQPYRYTNKTIYKDFVYLWMIFRVSQSCHTAPILSLIIHSFH